MDDAKYLYKDEEREEVLKKVKKDKNLTGDDIRGILVKYYESKGYLINSERNHTSSNENPFDLIVGKEKSYEMIGFEIKGDTDTFDRLAKQLQAYSFVFESVYLVLHKKKEPEWLPEYVGVIRVLENGEFFITKYTYKRDLYDIGSDYEWDSLLNSNGLGKISSKCKQSLKTLESIRANVLFNRFFGTLTVRQNAHTFDKFYPLSEQQKMVIIGFDVPFQMVLIAKEIKLVETKIGLIKKACKLDELKTVSDFFPYQESLIAAKSDKRCIDENKE